MAERFYVYDVWARWDRAASWDVYDRGAHGYANRKLVRKFKRKAAAQQHCDRCNADWEKYRDSMRRTG